MGLFDIDGTEVPDNKGGRPPKEEQEEDDNREAQGDPYSPDKDNLDWWDELFAQFVSGDEMGMDELSRMAGHAHVVPWFIVEKLDEHGVYEAKEELWRDDYPDRDFASDSSGGGSRIFSDEEEEEPSSGLQSLVENNK